MHLAVSEFVSDGRRFFTGMIHDLSDRKHVEEALLESERRLAQAQKMEAVGQLTGGIAHDFNNLLMVITGNLELLEPQLDGDDRRRAAQGGAGRRGARRELTDQLLAFARRRQLDTSGRPIERSGPRNHDLLRRALGEQIRLSTSLARVLGDPCRPGQFESALVNLAVNARDAMPQGGKLIVETAQCCARAPITSASIRAQARRLRAAVGLRHRRRHARRGRDRAFEPFFTTKEKGRAPAWAWPWSMASSSSRAARHHLQRGRPWDDDQPLLPARGRPGGGQRQAKGETAPEARG